MAKNFSNRDLQKFTKQMCDQVCGQASDTFRKQQHPLSKEDEAELHKAIETEMHKVINTEFRKFFKELKKIR